MTDVKISELPTGSASDTDVIPVVDGGATKKISLSALQAYIQSMGDNVKAKFGASDDLQIYHDAGGDSYIKESGAGNLYIEATNLRVKSANGATYIAANQGGAVTLYHDNATKLATTSTGVDVTGTVTADGLDVDGTIAVKGNNFLESDGTNHYIKTTATGANYLYGGNNIALTANSSGNVGIGTSSPTAKLDVSGAAGITSFTGATELGIVVKGSTGATDYSGMDFKGNSQANPVARIGALTTSSGSYLSFGTSNSYASGITNTAMTIDYAGNVGIGTSSPNYTLDTNSGSIEALDYRSEGVLYSTATTDWRWRTSTGAERMRIDSSGRLLVGKTASDATAGGTEGIELHQNGGLQAVRTSNNAGLFGRKGTDGTVVLFRKDTTTVGSISITGSSTAYNTSSDYRLKEDDVPMTGATERVKALRPINFAWKVDGSRVDGFFAHELAEVVPGAATGTKDAMRTEEYQISPALGEVFTPAVEGVEATYETVVVVEAVEAGFREVTPEVQAEPAYYDIDGNEIKAAVEYQTAAHEAVEAVEEVTEQRTTTEAVEAIAEVIVSVDVEQPEALEDGQQWRETVAEVMGEREVPDYQGIDQSKLVPLLTAALQDALTRIEALENA